MFLFVQGLQQRGGTELLAVAHPFQPARIRGWPLGIKGIKVGDGLQGAPHTAAGINVASIVRLQAQITDGNRPAAEVEGVEKSG